MSDFRRLGERVPFGEVAIDMAPAEQICDQSIFELSKVARSAHWRKTGVVDALRYAIYFPAHNGSSNAKERFVGVIWKEDKEARHWRLGISFLDYRLEMRHSNLRRRYLFESFAGQLVVAKQEIRAVQERGLECKDDGYFSDQSKTTLVQEEGLLLQTRPQCHSSGVVNALAQHNVKGENGLMYEEIPRERWVSERMLYLEDCHDLTARLDRTVSRARVELKGVA